METKKIKSSYLNKEFEVECEEVNGMTIITHRSLTNLVENVIDKKLGIKTRLTPYQGLSYPAFICTVTDNSGKLIDEVGGATAQSLTNNISRAFPVEMASNRAFDRAIIRFLGFEGKVYSDTEISVETPKSSKEKTEENTAPSIIVEEKEEVVEADVNASTDLGSYVIKQGKYKGKTLDEVKAEPNDKCCGIQYLTWLKDNSKDKELVDVLTRFLAE